MILPYRVDIVKGPGMLRKNLEKYNTDLVIDDFEYLLTSEYLE